MGSIVGCMSMHHATGVHISIMCQLLGCDDSQHHYDITHIYQLQDCCLLCSNRFAPDPKLMVTRYKEYMPKGTPGSRQTLLQNMQVI